MVRSQVNRVLVALTLLVVLPAIAVAERIRPGAGRRIAISTGRRLARACGVRVEVTWSVRPQTPRGGTCTRGRWQRHA